MITEPEQKKSGRRNTILFYFIAKDPRHYTFNVDEIDRIPYMAPGLVGKEKSERGKLPTDTWWHTIVPTNSKEKTAIRPRNLWVLSGVLLQLLPTW